MSQKYYYKTHQDRAAFSPRAAINPNEYIPYDIYSSLCYEDKLDLVSSTPFISSYTYLAEIADFYVPTVIDSPYAFSLKPIPTSENLFDNAIIYCSNWESSRQYLISVLEKSRKKTFIIFAHSIDPVGEDFLYFIERLGVIHVFAQNCLNPNRDYFTPIPLGHESKHIKNHGRISNSTKLLSKYQTFSLPQKQRKKLFLSAFSLNTNTNERISCLKSALKNENTELVATGNISTNKKSVMEQFYNRLATYRYVLCPWGAAYDTHRFWQALYLGCIPITRITPAYSDFLNIGGIFLNNWDDLNDHILMKEKTQEAVQCLSKNRFYFDYWKVKIMDIIKEKSK